MTPDTTLSKFINSSIWRVDNGATHCNMLLSCIIFTLWANNLATSMNSLTHNTTELLPDIVIAGFLWRRNTARLPDAISSLFYV
jgi:hypothetical protein